FLDADPAGFAETDLLGDRDLVRTAVVIVVPEAFFAGDDTLRSRSVRRAEVGTFVVTAVGLASIEVDDRDRIVRHQTAVWVVRRIVHVMNQKAKTMNAT